MRIKSGAVDLSDWKLGVTDSVAGLVEAAIKKGAKEAIELCLENDLTGVSLPGSEDDPLTVHIELDIGEDGDDPLVLETSLRDALKDDIELAKEDMMRGHSAPASLLRIRDGLRALADEIDALDGYGWLDKDRANKLKSLGIHTADNLRALYFSGRLAVSADSATIDEVEIEGLGEEGRKLLNDYLLNWRSYVGRKT